jgi:hypothetical protein
MKLNKQKKDTIYFRLCDLVNWNQQIISVGQLKMQIVDYYGHDMDYTPDNLLVVMKNSAKKIGYTFEDNKLVKKERV